MKKGENSLDLIDFEKATEKVEKNIVNRNYKTIRSNNVYGKKNFKNNFDFLYVWQTKRKAES